MKILRAIRKWIRMRLWRLGVGFLRLAGLKIPEITFKHQLIPVEIDASFDFPVGGDATMAKKQLRSAENSILNQCRPYIHVEHTDKGDYYKVRLKIVVQRYERN